MRTLILTSRGHCFANTLLKHLADPLWLGSGPTLIAEQTAVIPGRAAGAAVVRYLATSGFRYTAGQVVKQLALDVLGTHARLVGRTTCFAYPYHVAMPPCWTRVRLDDLGSSAAQERIRAFRPDLLLSLFSRERVPRAVLDLPPLGSVNLHPAYLPEYRGVSPTFWALSEGREQGGVTLHEMDERLDTGAILGRARVSTSGHESEHSFYLACVREGIPLLEAFLHKVRSSPRPRGLPQARKRGLYRSLPDRAAVRAFYDRGYRLFRFRELYGRGPDSRG